MSDVPENVKLQNAEKYLTASGLMDVVTYKENELKSIIKSIMRAGSMDDNTIIYRVAMTIYHAVSQAGAPFIEEIEDPGSIYLSLVNDEEMVDLIEETIKTKKVVSATSFIKTLSCFMISAWAFYKVKNEEE